MDAVLGLPLNPASTRRPTRAMVAVTAVALGLILVGQISSAGRAVATSPAAVPLAAGVPVLQTPVLLQVGSETIDAAASAQQVQTLTDHAMAFIEPFEDRRHRSYRDSRGYLTIGVGFNLDRPGAAEDINRLLPGVGYHALRRGEISLTDAQIDVLLRHDTQRATETARRQVEGFENLPLDAQLIVIDMTFNTGSLHKWRKLRSALARQDYAAASDAMHRSLWRRQTGHRAAHLIQMMRDITNG